MSRSARLSRYLGIAGILFLGACDLVDPTLQVPPDAQFSLSPSGITLEVGETIAIVVTLVRPNHQQVNPRALGWVSTNPSAASVDRDGIVTGRQPGQTQVIASSGQLADTTHVVVVAVGADKSGLVIVPEETTLDWIGATTDLAAKVYDEQGTLVESAQVAWRSEQSEIAEIDGMGELTARGVGLALIVATAPCCDRADTAYAHVRQIAATVSMETAAVSLAAGETRQLWATVLDEGGTPVGDATVAWASSNTSVATVSPTGLVSGVSDGSATITARSGDAVAATSVTVGASSSTPPSGGGAGVAELPRQMVDTSWPGYSRVVDVAAGQSIQDALDNAKPGDFIRVAPGTYYEHLTLRPNAGAPIILGSVQPPGRARPGTLPKVVGTNSTRRVLSVPEGASNYRIVGLEFQYEGVDKSNAVVHIDHASHIVLDRIVAGTDAMELQRAVILHGTHLAVIDSWLMAGYKGADSQAIVSWSGRGPYHIEGNYLAGAGENVMLGGATPRAGAGMPQDVTIRRNHFHKPDAWRDGRFTVKNSFEIKFAARVLLEGNVFDGNWSDGQDGYAFNLKLSDRGDGDRSEDLTIRYNIVKNTHRGFRLTGGFNRNVIEHNLILGPERAFLIITHNDLHLIHNTVIHTHNIIGADRESLGFVARGNIWGHSTGFGLKGNMAEGTASLDHNFPGWTYRDNGHVARPESRYPTGNRFVETQADVRFNPDWSLRSDSPFTGLGADIAKLLAMTAGVE
jgi:uncharacterized protein YjdB